MNSHGEVFLHPVRSGLNRRGRAEESVRETSPVELISGLGRLAIHDAGRERIVWSARLAGWKWWRTWQWHPA